MSAPLAASAMTAHAALSCAASSTPAAPSSAIRIGCCTVPSLVPAAVPPALADRPRSRRPVEPEHRERRRPVGRAVNRRTLHFPHVAGPGSTNPAAVC